MLQKIISNSRQHRVDADKALQCALSITQSSGTPSTDHMYPPSKLCFPSSGVTIPSWWFGTRLLHGCIVLDDFLLL